MNTIFFVFFLALLSAPSVSARVIEAEAIPFAGFLSKADFDARYPGRVITDVSELEPGWYVIYEHEALQYFFGPISLESTGQDYLAQLEGIVAEAVSARPSIQDYTLELSYEPSQLTAPSAGTGSAGGGATPPQQGSGGSGGAGTQSGGGSWGIFEFFRRIFGG
ncbi:MAG: hypothetical protein AAGC73_01730 [Verrucomicrobiota bacterium]